ncbi:MAG: uroporphyrinogen-III synthase [Thermonemataceae bacterium]|nr:uroporphyrinogen-III synthase [Thermonemataceae bacterium]
MNEVPFEQVKDRVKPVTSILVTQAAPTDAKSPYYELAKKYNVKIDFRSFIQVDRIALKDFRKQKINPLDFSAIIFTSRNAVDHFFSICKEMKVEMPPETKYFCISEQTANYLQKYIVIRKRKIFTGVKVAADLLPAIKKNKDEKFLFPCSDIRKDELPMLLEQNNINFTESVMYHTVASDLSDLAEVKYDILAFFSPSGIASLFTNFPDFVQENTRIAAFGPTTAKAVKDAGLVLDIEAPLPNAPSMAGALENYIRLANKI